MSYVHTLEITTVSRCSLACTFCPQDKLKESYKGTHKLSFSDFRKILRKVPDDVRIHFSGFVEPWLNESCTSMLSYALYRHRVAIYTTLQGMSDPYTVAALLEYRAGLVDVICIHLPDRTGHMRGFVDSPEWHEAVEAFRGLQEDGLPVEWMSMGEPHVNGRRLNIWDPNDRAASLTPDIAPRIARHRGPIACSYTDTYTHNVMLPNGDVVLCCNDYGLKHKLGNLLTQSWEEIVNGPEMQRIKAENAKADGETICRKCNGATPCAS